jgi:cytochrome c-type biogenesis protein CcmH
MRATRVLAWVVLAVVLVGALVVGSGRRSGPRTPAQRAHHLAAELRCPTCRNLSVADSDAAAARAVRAEIGRRVAAGDTDAEIRAFLVSRYGDDILLTPPSSGVGALAWGLPVAAVICAAVALWLAFARWERRLHGHPTAADQALVDRARAT